MRAEDTLYYFRKGTAEDTSREFCMRDLIARYTLPLNVHWNSYMYFFLDRF